jgi:predicted histone-like DNA-binding protein
MCNFRLTVLSYSLNFDVMSILIKAVERANPLKREEKKYYASVATRGTIDLDGLCELICKFSSLSKGDVNSVLLNLFDAIPIELLDGKVVKLGKLGSLSLNVDGAGVATAQEVTGDLVKSVHVIFRPSKEFKDDLDKFTIRTS